MRLSTETIVRSCDPDRDLEAVVQNIKRTGLYREGQDNPETLREFLTVVPTSILILEDRKNEIIAGNVYVPFSQVPILARVAVNEVFKDTSRDYWEVQRLVLNGAFDEIRRRHRTMPHAEILYDWPPPLARSEPPPPLGLEYQRLGFEFTYDLYGAEFRLRDSEGNPTYIPAFPDNMSFRA